MTDRPNDLLLLAGQVLAVFAQIALGIAAIAVIVALIALPLLPVFGVDIAAEIAAETGSTPADFPLAVIMAILAMALIAVGLLFVFFAKLRAIIASVGDGDPFVPENADRLSAMAWLLLIIQLMTIPASGLGLLLLDWAEQIKDVHMSFELGFDLTGILLVVILFILARVFKHGAAMRADLEGTV